mgnify:CR=1 FL=1
MKGGAPPPGDGIRHRMSMDGGRTWGNSTLVLTGKLQASHSTAKRMPLRDVSLLSACRISSPPATQCAAPSPQPGHNPAETISGKFFPSLLGGKGAMVLVTDGGKAPGQNGCLHAYISTAPGFVTPSNLRSVASIIVGVSLQGHAELHGGDGAVHRIASADQLNGHQGMLCYCYALRCVA